MVYSTQTFCMVTISIQWFSETSFFLAGGDQLRFKKSCLFVIKKKINSYEIHMHQLYYFLVELVFCWL